MTIEDKFDPTEYHNETAFKQAVYDEHGAGSWIDDMKLKIIYKEAHNEPISDHLEPLLKE